MNELAHVTGGTDIPLIEQTIGALFDDVSEQYADVMALISCHQHVYRTYSDLRQRVDALACNLHLLGLKKGDRLGIWSPNCEEWALTQFATAKLGVILVNINPAYRTSEIDYVINKVGCRALIIAPAFKSSNYVDMMHQICPELLQHQDILQSARLPSLEFVICMGTDKHKGMLTFDDLLAAPTDGERHELQTLGDTLEPNDVINIQFTSGTTGSPKGATLTHRNILNNGFNVTEGIGLKKGERLCIPVPLYHCFGMVMGNLGCVTHAATMVYPSRAFDPLAVLEAVEKEKCVGLYAVPTMFIAIVDHAERSSYDLSSLRTGIMAGSPCPIEVMKKVIHELGCTGVTIAYGMTETSPVSFQSRSDDSIERRVSTVGQVAPHCEVKIVDSTGQTVQRGEVGELCTRGYLVMQGYWNDEQRTHEAIDKEGFMHTGDLAVIDEDGYCNITGRSKDVIIRGGENVYPREVEEYLYRHPAITDVQVVGVPDKTYGEELCACIIAKNESVTEADIRQFCQGHIAHYKIPRYVHVVDEFPMTVTGKIQKYLLREAVAKILGLSAIETA